MSADSLSPVLEAYRAERAGAGFRANVVRQRVLASLARKRERRTRLLRWTLPLAATFFASAALAATEPVRLRVQQAFERVELLFTSEGTTPAKPAEPPRKREAPAAPAPSETTSTSEATPPHGAPVLSLEELPLEQKPAAASARDASRAGGTGAQPDLDLAAYRRAHELHFHGSDPALSLAAWDAYLAAFPEGTFAPEARVNRAVSLARVGKRDDARRALDAIAGGAPDGYSRARAASLLEALDER